MLHSIDSIWYRVDCVPRTCSVAGPLPVEYATMSKSNAMSNPYQQCTAIPEPNL